MKNIIRYIIIGFLLLLTTACETNVDTVDLPEFSQKLIVTSFISPSDSVSYFLVSSNRRLYGELNPSEDPGNLSGYISDGTREIALDTFRYGLKFSHRKMQVQYGGKYHIRISSDRGMNAEAECQVPGKRIFEIEADTFSVPSKYEWPGDDRGIGLKIAFVDIPGEKNYYRMDIHGWSAGHFKSSHDPVEDRFREGVFTDDGLDGKMIDIKAGIALNSMFHADSAKVIIHLYNTDESYYLYHKSLRDYSDGNPFSEATPVYSNINGGLGIFSAYTVDSLIIRIEKGQIR